MERIWLAGKIFGKKVGRVCRMVMIGGVLIGPFVPLAGCNDQDHHDPDSTKDTTHLQQEQSPIDHSGATPGAGQDDTQGPQIPLTTPEGGTARLAFRSGHIRLEYEGVLGGVREIWFDDWGLKERTYDSAFAVQTPLPLVPPFTLTILTPDYYGGIDLRTNKGERASTNPFTSYIVRSQNEKRPVGELVLESSGAERLADTMIDGKYYCRTYQKEEPGFIRTIWTWGGVPIAEKVEMSGIAAVSYRVMPRSVDTNITVDPKLFTFPEGYEITSK